MIFIAHEPQIALRQEHRIDKCAVLLISYIEQPVENRSVLRQIHLIFLEMRRLARLRIVSLDLQSYIHQYDLTCGSHLVIVTGR